MSKRKLILCYEAYVEVVLPSELADKLESGEIPFTDDWGVITFTDQDGDDVEIEGKTQDVDYKRAHRHYWEDNTEDRAILKWQEFLKQREANKIKQAQRLSEFIAEFITKDFVDYGEDVTAPRIKISEASKYALQDSEKSRDGDVQSDQCGDEASGSKKYD
jgi:hypothetical protein